jgi:hypothetical protein
MTIHRLRLLRSLVFVACIATACARPAVSQQAGSTFPPRPAGAACEQRLQRVRSVATPSAKREELLAAFTPLYACKDRELGQGIAAAIVAVRATTDSALATTAFNGGFAYRDSAIVRAAAQVAADRGASELVRVLGFLSLYTTLAPGGYQPPLREFVAQPRGVTTCGFTAATHTGTVVELTPRSPALRASVGEVARSVASDPAVSPALNSAAACVLGVWRQ